MTFKDRCTISENCLPESRYKAMLTNLHSEMLARITELENTVRVLGQGNAWINFGECWAVYDSVTENINTNKLGATEKHLRDRLNKDLGESRTNELIKYNKIKLVKCTMTAIIK